MKPHTKTILARVISSIQFAREGLENAKANGFEDLFADVETGRLVTKLTGYLDVAEAVAEALMEEK